MRPHSGQGACMSSRQLLPLACAAMALTLVPAAQAAAGGPKLARFTATAKATQTTTWKRHTVSGGDCFEHWETTAAGSETVKFKAKKAKVLAARTLGGMVALRTGTWNLDDYQPKPWLANGSVDRDDRTKPAFTAGDCGSKSDPDLAPLGNDCGSHPRRYEVALGYDPQKHKVSVGVAGARDFDPLSFDHCGLMTPPGVSGDS